MRLVRTISISNYQNPQGVQQVDSLQQDLIQSKQEIQRLLSSGGPSVGRRYERKGGNQCGSLVLHQWLVPAQAKLRWVASPPQAQDLAVFKGGHALAD